MISWHGTTNLPEEIRKTVRLSVTCKNPPASGDILLKIGVLIYGRLMNVEHVMEIATYTHVFSASDYVKVINDLLPYRFINSICNCYSIEECTRRCTQRHPLLIGDTRDFKIQIILIPLVRNMSIVDYPYNSTFKIPNLPI